MFRQARSVNQTSNGFVSKVATNTTPSGDAGSATGASIIELGSNAGIMSYPNAVVFVPYAVAASNNTFSVRVIGWTRYGDTSTTWLWIPVTLCEIACTAGTSPGVAAMNIDNTHLFADTVTLTTGDAASTLLSSPADNTIASVMTDLRGAAKLEFSFTTGGSATSCNALYRFV
jgi:hypothetical protein